MFFRLWWNGSQEYRDLDCVDGSVTTGFVEDETEAPDDENEFVRALVLL